MTTGTPSDPHLHDLISGYGGLPFLPKPVSFVDLAEKLERLLGIPATPKVSPPSMTGLTSAVRLPLRNPLEVLSHAARDLRSIGWDRSGGVCPDLHGLFFGQRGRDDDASSCQEVGL